MLTLESIVVISPRVVSQIVGQEAVLVLSDHSQVKVLNEVGARIWSMIDGTASIQVIADRISQEFQVDPIQAEVDTLEFIRDLSERGIVLEAPV